jgi:XTP/dITP diphosphohydrolase
MSSSARYAARPMEPMRVLVATSNRGKAAELALLFSDLPIALVMPEEIGGIVEVDEDAETLEGNARKKAREIGRAAGLPCIADDSGLEVLALGGAPGVHSARYAGEPADDRANVAKLLRELAGVTDRRARFRCVLVFYDPATGDELDAEGTCEGVITTERRGDGGFGYDPVLLLPVGRTMAELGPEEKSAVSHRGAAARRLAELLRKRLAAG